MNASQPRKADGTSWNQAYTYRIATIFPASGPAGTGVTVFATNFHPSDTVTVVVGSTSVTSYTSRTTTVLSGYSGSQAYLNGVVATSFSVPKTLAPGSYTVTVSDQSGDSMITASNFTVTSGPAVTGGSSAVAGYRVGIGDPNPADSNVQQAGIGWLNSSTGTFDPSTNTCNTGDDTGVQQLTLTVNAPNGAGESVSIVVTDPDNADSLVGG